MIIQCRKCRTKFRFDETIISGEGVWVRCSICKDIFFQDNPAQGGIARPGTEDAVFAQEPVVPHGQGRAAAMPESFGPASSGPEFPGPELSPGKFPDEADDAFPEEDGEDLLAATDRRLGFGKLAAYLLFLLVVIGGLSLWLFSPSGGQGYPEGRAIRQWALSFPLVEKILEGSPRQQDFSIGQVVLKDLKQRVVKNMLLGDLRVIEGTALNRSPYSISRIQVRGRMYNATGIVLNERISYCGNILTDEELASLTEGAMQTVLSLPQGRNTSNERIMADDGVPFMIVFANIPPAMAKITVSPLGAERLLP